MNIDKIKENNAIIAKYMGYQVDNSSKFFFGIHYYKMRPDYSHLNYMDFKIDEVRSYTDGFQWTYYRNTEKRYDTSWDELLPVLTKIQKEVIKDGDEIAIELYKGAMNTPITYVSIQSIETKHKDPVTALYKAIIKYLK